MFFRREKPQEWTFESRLADLKKFGFESTRDAQGRTIARRGNFGAVVEDGGAGKVGIGKAGVLMGGEIAHLIHGGFQMFLRTESGKELPALAEQLKGLHSFDEDLREGLGLTSLYNLALGTTCDDHLYDRVQDRDAVRHAKPWEKKIAPHA
ncbi:MAG: hypothetical protein ABI811_02760 [Acidobacteriota bacterium]